MMGLVGRPMMKCPGVRASAPWIITWNRHKRSAIEAGSICESTVVNSSKDNLTPCTDNLFHMQLTAASQSEEHAQG